MGIGSGGEAGSSVRLATRGFSSSRILAISGLIYTPCPGWGLGMYMYLSAKRPSSQLELLTQI